MTLLPSSATETSVVVATVSRVRARLSAAASDARSVRLVRRLGLIADTDDPKSDDAVTAESATAAEPSPDSSGGRRTDTAETTSGAAATATGTAGSDAGGENTAETTSLTAGEPPTTDAPASSSRQSVNRSRTYALARRGRRFVTTSWLYGWLTAEPEPEVIVIDLRETRIVGAVLGVIDRVVARSTRDFLPALPSATATRASYWLRDRAAARPLRVVSIGVALAANLGLLVVLAGESDPLQPATLLLLAMLLAAARGFRSTMSWDELTSTTWYQRTTSALAAAFEPPEPPTPASDRPVTPPASKTDVNGSNGAEPGPDSADSSADRESSTNAASQTPATEPDPDTVDKTDTDASGAGASDAAPSPTGESNAATGDIADDPVSTTDGSDRPTEAESDEPH